MEAEKIDYLTPPNIVVFSGNDWESYQNDLFSIFEDTIIKNKLLFQGLPVTPRRFPEYKGKHFTFWHLISEGEKEDDRTPDLRRCERIGWISWIIKNCENHPGISYWENQRGNSRNVVLWYEEGQFAVILAKRSKYFVMLSAYQITEERRIKTFQRDRDEYRKSIYKS